MHANAPGTSITGGEALAEQASAACPGSRSWTSASEDHAAYLIAQPFDVFGVGGATEALGQVEEFLLAFVSLHVTIIAAQKPLLTRSAQDAAQRATSSVISSCCSLGLNCFTSSSMQSSKPRGL
jgi:hypothetical protein